MSLNSIERYTHLVYADSCRRCSPPSSVEPPETSAAATAPAPEVPDEFLLRLLQRAGLRPEHYRASALQRRTGACLRAVRARSTAEAQQRLERCPELLPGLLSTLLIGVTEFLRDRPVFDFLGGEGLTRVVSRMNRAPQVVSLGCSDGRELYSVALLLAERDLLADSVLTGVDCRTAALAAAHAAWYEPAALDPVPVEWRARYFNPESNEYRVAPLLRARARWRLQDVCTAPLPSADIILCRNLLIYLERAAAAELWHRLAGTLAPGGLLVTGRAERPPLDLKLTRLAPCIYTKE